jgi:hypothetical protein
MRTSCHFADHAAKIIVSQRIRCCSIDGEDNILILHAEVHHPHRFHNMYPKELLPKNNR